MRKRLRAIVKGRVQGVGFRWYVQQQAGKLKVTGYVRNLSNGDVELVAEGREEDVDSLLARVRSGPTFSRVTEVVVEQMPRGGKYDTFEIT